MKKEEWANIPGFEGIYQINRNGVIKSLERKRKDSKATLKEKILKINYNKTEDYYQVRLTNGDSSRTYAVHILVANTFIPNPNKYRFINHINRDTSDNRVENLEWVKSSHTSPMNVANRVMYKLYHQFGWTPEQISELTENSVPNIKAYLGLSL